MPSRQPSRVACILTALLAGVAQAAGPKPAFSIGAMTDSQYAVEPDAPPRLYHTTPDKLAAAVNDFNRQHLSFVVHLGDFIDKDWASFDAMMPITQKLRTRWRFVLGNHDFAVDDAHKAQVSARLGMPGRYYSFVEHGWMFVVTDGNGLSSYAWPAGSLELASSLDAHMKFYPEAPLWDGGIEDAQWIWIDKQLGDAARRGLKVMLFSHFPLWPENPHNLWNAPAIRAMLAHHPSVKIWLSGHNHEGNYGLLGGVHFLTLKAMLDTPQTAYATLDFYRDHVVVNGVGRQASLVMQLETREPLRTK